MSCCVCYWNDMQVYIYLLRGGQSYISYYMIEHTKKQHQVPASWAAPNRFYTRSVLADSGQNGSTPSEQNETPGRTTGSAPLLYHHVAIT